MIAAVPGIERNLAISAEDLTSNNRRRLFIRDKERLVILTRRF
jgi:hypothetical protein